MDVKFQRCTVEGEEAVAKEYLDVICPTDLPRWVVLKTIQAVLKVNGSKGSAREYFWREDKDEKFLCWGDDSFFF